MYSCYIFSMPVKVNISKKDHLLWMSSFQIMSKFISKRNSNLSRVGKNFKIDYKIEALLDISDMNFPEKTIVVHSELGVFKDLRTTKQIMNEMHLINGIGFAMTKFLVDFYGITHYTPFVYENIAYMPMTGASRRNADWIAVHFLDYYEQIGKKAHFDTKNGHQIQMDFPRGNLEKRLHDTYFLTQSSLKILGMVVTVGNCRLNYPCNRLFSMYDRCRCDLHSKICLLNSLLTFYWYLIEFVLLNQGIDDLGKIETKKFYHQNLKKIKKLY